MRRPGLPRTGRRTAEDEILLNRLAEAAVANADGLLSDARVLQEKASFGHAFALAVLSEEELGKATVLWLAALDKTARLTRDRKLMLGNQLYEPFASHPMKQAVQLGPGFLGSLFEPILGELLKMLEQGSLNPDTVMQTVDKYFDDLIKDTGRWLETLKPLIELGGLEREKQSGLYVDYQKGKIVKPSDFPSERAKQLIDRVAQEIHSTRANLSKVLPEGFEDIFLTGYSLFERSNFAGIVKRWKAGKLSQSRLQKETKKIKRQLTAALQDFFREQKSENP